MKEQSYELIRYLINGLIATFVHYSVLILNMQIFEFNSAGLANLIASICGIITSFIGNRYFVFKDKSKSILMQLINFISLYAYIAIINCIILFVWSDIMKKNYQIGFILTLILQIIIGYFANKKIIFK
jgi:putative flippase GtrA